MRAMRGQAGAACGHDQSARVSHPDPNPHLASVGFILVYLQLPLLCHDGQCCHAYSALHTFFLSSTLHPKDATGVEPRHELYAEDAAGCEDSTERILEDGADLILNLTSRV